MQPPRFSFHDLSHIVETLIADDKDEPTPPADHSEDTRHQHFTDRHARKVSVLRNTVFKKFPDAPIIILQSPNTGKVTTIFGYVTSQHTANLGQDLISKLKFLTPKNTKTTNAVLRQLHGIDEYFTHASFDTHASIIQFESCIVNLLLQMSHPDDGSFLHLTETERRLLARIMFKSVSHATTMWRVTRTVTFKAQQLAKNAHDFLCNNPKINADGALEQAELSVTLAKTTMENMGDILTILHYCNNHFEKSWDVTPDLNIPPINREVLFHFIKKTHPEWPTGIHRKLNSDKLVATAGCKCYQCKYIAQKLNSNQNNGS